MEALEAAAQLVNAVIGYDRVNTTETVANGGVVILYGPDETAATLPEWEYVVARTSHFSDDHPGFTASGGGITFSVVVWDDPVCAVPPQRHDAYGTPNTARSSSTNSRTSWPVRPPGPGSATS